MKYDSICGEFEIPRTEFLLHRVKQIEQRLIKWCRDKKYSQGDSYSVWIDNKGRWNVKYSNDYPLQHGEGKTFLLSEEEFNYAIHNYI